MSATPWNQPSLGHSTHSETASYTRALGLPAGSTSQLINNYNIKKWYQEARLQSASNGHFEWLVGFVYQSENSHTDGLVTILGPSGVLLPQPAGQASFSFTNNELNESAGFVNAILYLTPQFDLSAGYRRSHITQDNNILQYGYVFEPATPTVPITRKDRPVNDVNTYSFGARWRVRDDVLLYARAASGFRPGGGRGQPPVVIPNFVFSYNPDSVWSYEAGVKASAWRGRVAVDLDTFYIDWSNIQTLVLAAPGQPYFINGNGNGGDAVSKGLEGQLTLAPVAGLSVIGNFALTDSHFAQTIPQVSEKGGELQYVARYTSSLQVEYERPVAAGWDGFIGADYRYRSSMLDAFGYRMPAYDQGGLHIGAQKGGTRLSAFVINLTDHRGLLGYTGGGNQATDPYRYAVTPPRTVGVSLTQKW